MNKDEIYTRIQNQLRDVPLILIGTGGTIPYGISGMWVLADELKSKLDNKYSSDKAWQEFSSRLARGIDLENALTNLQLSEEIKKSIVEVTWQLVSRDDIKLMHKWAASNYRPELGKIIHKFYEANPQCVNIITTNYDRVIEYACDKFRIPINTLFYGEYYKYFSKDRIKKSQIVNILKVHGSLDWFFDDSSQVISLPLQKNIPTDLFPAIVTPGTEKYERVLKLPFRDVIHVADDLISKATGFLCIGYGFNDSQIQENIIGGIKMGKPITVWTKKLSHRALDIIKKAGKEYIIAEAEDGNDSKSRIIFPDGETCLDEKIWDMEGLLKII